MTTTPSLIVFDLDFTLWDCGGVWVDCSSPPYKLEGGKIYDQRDEIMRLYEDVPEILDWCDANNIPMALASRTTEPDWARELLQLMDLPVRFPFQEIYPSEKTRHFSRIQAESGVPYSEMLFFDDEQRNIIDVQAIGVDARLVRTGLNATTFHHSIETFGQSASD